MSNKKEDNYIEDFKEWQNHQYDPYYFIGNRMPPFYKKPPRRLGWIFLGEVILIVLLFMFLFVAVLTSDPSVHTTVDFGDTDNPLTLIFSILTALLVIGMLVLYAWAGVSILRKKLKRK